MFNIAAQIAAEIAAAELAGMIDEEVRQERIRAQRQLNAQMRQHSNPFITLTEADFMKNFRLPKVLAQRLFNQIDPLLPDEGSTSRIPKHLQFLTASVFYGTGCYQQQIAVIKYFYVSQAIVSQIITNVTDAINTLKDDYIQFPQTIEEWREISQGFQGDIRFPDAVGCIDCTHIPILTPIEEPWLYKNYKGYYSLNVQVTCDHKMRITSVDAYPGRCHDSAIWNRSVVKDTMERLNDEFQENLFLSGDAGYPLSTIIMTPIPNANKDSTEFRYT